MDNGDNTALTEGIEAPNLTSYNIVCTGGTIYFLCIATKVEINLLGLLYLKTRTGLLGKP